MKNLNLKIGQLFLLTLLTGLVGCGGGGDDDDDGGNPPPPPPVAKVYTLNQAAFNGSTYAYGHNSTPSLKIINAPADTDYNRWAKLHDGGNWRLYFFKKGSNTTIYQFAYNSPAKGYEYGYNGAIPELSIVGAPADANPAQFSMLHDGNNYRLYMQSKTNLKKLYQFAFNGASYAYGYSSIANLRVTGMPTESDRTSFAMNHDGSNYRFYFKQVD